MEGRLAEEAEDEAAAKQNMPLMAFRIFAGKSKIAKRDQISKMLEELKKVRFETNDPHYSDFSFHPWDSGHTKQPDELLIHIRTCLLFLLFSARV